MVTQMGIMAASFDDLPELDIQLKQAVDDLLAILNFYETKGRILVQEVVSRLRRLADPPGIHARAAVKAAEDLESAIESFSILQVGLMANAGFVGMAANSVANSLQVNYLTSIGRVSVHIEPGQDLLKSVLQYSQDLKDTSEQSAAQVLAIARMVGAQAIDAFNAVTDVVLLRLFFLVKFLDATNPPESVTDSKGKTYVIELRNATATESIFFAGEEALKRLGIELVGQVPVVSIVTSLAKIVLDVRKEVKHFNEKQALWQEIIQAPYKRNVAEEALDYAEDISKDDEAIRQLSESLADAARQLSAMSTQVLRT
jgi:hypothetical protein